MVDTTNVDFEFTYDSGNITDNLTYAYVYIDSADGCDWTQDLPTTETDITTLTGIISELSWTATSDDTLVVSADDTCSSVTNKNGFEVAIHTVEV